MHHKRKKSKNQRAGCLMCKPWKVNGVATQSKEGEKFSDHRRRMSHVVPDYLGKQGPWAKGESTHALD